MVNNNSIIIVYCELHVKPDKPSIIIVVYYYQHVIVLIILNEFVHFIIIFSIVMRPLNLKLSGVTICM